MLTPTMQDGTGTIGSPQRQAFTSHDGAALSYRVWRPAAPNGQAVLLIHRGHEHGGRFEDVVPELELGGATVYAWDMRGHGLSAGEAGKLGHFAELVRDLEAFARHVEAEHGHALADQSVVAHSVGAVLAAAWVHDYAPPIRSMVLVTPAFRVKLYVPMALPAIRAGQHLRRDLEIKSYVKPGMLTRDAKQAQRYREDELIHREIAASVLVSMHDTADRLVRDAGTIQTPTLVLSAGRDVVVRMKEQRAFFDRLGSPRKRYRLFDEGRHDLLHDLNRESVLSEISEMICRESARSSAANDAASADRFGYTAQEYEWLTRPVCSYRKTKIAAERAVIRAAGRISDGVKVGLASGFDSGATLDYVYENEARGRWGVGRWIDRFYLNAVGWRGIRQRRLHNRELLMRAVRSSAMEHPGRPVRLLDIAAGCGRYTLDAALALHQEGLPVEVLLRDNTPSNLVQAERYAEQLGLAGVWTEVADAFDETGLRQLGEGGAFDVAIVSGLYELFPENQPVLASMHGLRHALRPAGWLIYTGQPWHPQLKMIARLLDNRLGQPWVMRRRSQAELDGLVRSAGFVKDLQLIDEDGIFTVSLARRLDEPEAGK